MKKVILIGASYSGKTSLAQAVNQLPLDYKKTQTVEYISYVLDTPGEYIENRNYYPALIVSSYDCDIIGLVQDATEEKNIFPPSFASIFSKPVIGLITKIDCRDANINSAKQFLTVAGVERIFELSSLKGIGIRELKKYLSQK